MERPSFLNASQGRALSADRRQRVRPYSPVVHLTAFLPFLGWVVVAGDWHQAIAIAIAVLIPIMAALT